MPYLPIDPMDVGRTYDADVIRINSQSGKGGVCYVLKENYGMVIPDKMKEDVGYTVKDVSDKEHRELTPSWIYRIFEEKYIGNNRVFSIPECHFKKSDGIIAEVTVKQTGGKRMVTGVGNGRLDAVSNAIKQYFGVSYELSAYEEHAMTSGSSSKAITYVGITWKERMYWGAGIDPDIITSSIHALASAVNQIPELSAEEECKDERLNEIMNYIQVNYQTVDMEELAEHFHLSKPYLSKYIKEKSGDNFGKIVKDIRMKKARTLIRSTSQSIERISEQVGYQNVEHFNRLFKQKYGMTPVQYRNQK